MTNQNTSTESSTISAAEAIERLERGALLIDVRSEGGRASTGSVPNAIVVGKDSVGENFEAASKAKLPQLETTDQDIVVFCGSVAGSGPVVEQLWKLGYHRAVDVDGGFEALRSAGLPTTAASRE